MPRTAVTAAGDGRLTAHHVEVLARTVQRQQHRLSSDPTFMSGHLHNALRIDGDDDVHDALCARAISSLANRTWLQLLHRPPVPRSAFLRAFDVGSEVVAVCWLAGDDQLVTAGGRSITIWDAESGREITRLDMPEGVSTAAAAPSRDLLAWGETGGAVRLWDACAGVERQLDGAHTDRVEAVAFSPSGAWLASTAQDRNVRIWNLERGGCRAIECAVVADRLVFFPDERCLAFDLAGSVHLHPLDSGPDTEVVLTQSVAQNTAVGMVSKLGPPKRSAIAVASDGRRFAGGGFAGARVWDLAGEPEPWIADVADGVLAVAFSPDGTSLATGADRPPFVELWDIVARDSPSELEGHQRDVFALAFSPDGRALASAGWDPYAILWDVDTGARRAVLAGHTSRIETLVFSPSSRVLATGSADGTVRLWDAHVPLVDDDPADLDVRHPARAETAAYASNARVAATGVGLDVLIWSGDIGAKWNGASSDDAYVRKLGLSADGRVLGVGELIHTREGTTHAARVWDLVEDRSITELVIDGRATAVALSPPGDTVSVAVEAVVLVEGLTRDPHTRSLTHDAPVTALCFSPDGHWLATGGQSEPIRIWDLERGSYLTLQRRDWSHTTVKALAFSDDGARLAGAVTAGVGIWDARDGSLLAHVWPRSASALAFSSDGDILAVATERDAQVRVWDMPTLLEAPPDGRSLVLLEGTERTWMHDRAITCAAAHCLSPVLALAFVPGEHVIAAIDDGSASANVPLSYLFEVSTPANAGH